MPTSPLHEAVVALFRARPSLAAELLRDALHERLPPFDRALLATDSVTTLDASPLHADALLRFERDGRTVFAVLVEVQLRPEPGKRASWAVYLAALARSVGCEARLLVVTLDRRTARWAAEPIQVGSPRFVLHFDVLGPDGLPRVVAATGPERAPEEVLLSALVHADAPDAGDLAPRLVDALARVDEPLGALYIDLIIRRASKVLRAKLEEMMLEGYVPQTRLAKHYLAWRAALRREAEAQAQAHAEGVAAGRAEGVAAAVLDILDVRGLSVSDELRARVLACRDLALLDGWLRRAVTVASAEAVFE